MVSMVEQEMDDDETEDLNEMNELEMTLHKKLVVKKISTNIKVRTMSVQIDQVQNNLM